MSINIATLGFPRIGAFRELKKAVEGYWKKELSKVELNAIAADIRKSNWELQKNNGVTYIPSNDFSFYDQILDTSCMVGNIPTRFNFSGGSVDLDTYFKVARGNTDDSKNNQCASEMTKWFDTNYHYIVPEFKESTSFSLSDNAVFDYFTEAKELGINTRPVLVGPVTYLKIGKVMTDSFNKYDLLPSLVEVYKEVLKKLASLGATDVQIDEPIAVLDLTDEERAALTKTYDELSKVSSLNIHLTTYFGDLRENQETVYNLPVESIHLDAVRGVDSIKDAINAFPSNKQLSVGVINGRNIWINDFEKSKQIIDLAIEKVGADNIIISSSCSLLHTPVSLASEEKLNPEIKQWLSFATEKLNELSHLSSIIFENNQQFLSENKDLISKRATSNLIHNQDVKARVKNIKDSDFNRQSDFTARQKQQIEYFNFPLFPTTTIGSFPQTSDVRKNRADFKKGLKTEVEYNEFIKEKIHDSVKFQDEIDMDVYVHGEFERNDMVEYFGEQLEGFTFTQFGWVQSYGSRCVKPPIIYGDVSRSKPMTVEWSKYAQSLTEKQMKGMLTGPVTILQWSFVRDDQPRKDTTFQIALAIRDEVVDLEAAKIEVIQIDEAALREGLPLRMADWDEYLTWSVDSFKLSTAGVEDETQIHTHMCYSEFNDIIEAIARMDADVISIETSRSNMELLDAFVSFNYPNEVGPGVYDIHSPRIPSQENMTDLIKKATELLPIRNIWVNPDCGLKTRGWPEVKEALESMVNSAKELREAFKETTV